MKYASQAARAAADEARRRAKQRRKAATRTRMNDEPPRFDGGDEADVIDLVLAAERAGRH